MATERLQKYLAAAGVTSRRRAEELIVAGRVVVNGKVVRELGSKIDPVMDLVSVDGKAILRNESRAYYLLYKPPGCVTTASDPQGRPIALDYLRGVRERLFAVGRLDFDAEGALLFTDDGELANRLAHPRYGHARTYLVKVRGVPHELALARMKAGVRLEDGPAKALEAVVHEKTEKNTWVRIVVGEGRFHLVKRLCEAVGLQIQRLYRPEFGGITVEGLKAGEFRPLTSAEVKATRALVGLTTTRDTPRPPLALPKAARRHGHGPPSPEADPYARVAATAPPPAPMRASSARSPNERSPNERSPNERSPNERPSSERQPGGRQPSERRADERRPNERRPNERRPNERRPNERRPNERRPNERRPNERRPNERRPNERRPNEPNERTTNPPRNRQGAKNRSNEPRSTKRPPPARPGRRPAGR